MNNKILNNVINLLKSNEEPKWQTATNIAKKLGNDFHGQTIEQLLIEHYKENEHSNIRYSSLPSRRSLQILWGHIEKVGNRKLFDIFKEDSELAATYLNNVEDERNLFLSHSFQDATKIFDLAHSLVNFNLNPWIAEVDISYRSHINHEVINAIENLPFFGIYLSKNVLKSKWSAKELEFAIQNKRKLFAFIPEDQHEIIDLVENNIPIEHMHINELLGKIFDKHEISESIKFFLFGNKTNLRLNKIQPIHEIHHFI